jgi:hypothetical protein
MSGPVDIDRVLAMVQLAELIGKDVNLTKEGDRSIGLCPFHKEDTPSFGIFQGKDGHERYHCFGCNVSGDALDYLMETRGVSLIQAAEIITGVANDLGPRHNCQKPPPPHDPYAGVNPLPMPSGVPMPVSGETINVWNPRRERHSTYTPTAVYRYGCGYVLRIEFEKDTKFTPQIMWCEHDGKNEWSHYSFPNPRPLYGVESIPAEGQIIVVEGEKTADAARRMLNMPVVTWAGGTSAVGDTDYSPLASRSVVIVPDADDPGRKAAGQIAFALYQAGAAQIKIIDTDGQPKGWDLADAEAEGWNRDGAIEWLKAHVQDWEPPDPTEAPSPPAETTSRPAKRLQPSSKAQTSDENQRSHTGQIRTTDTPDGTEELSDRNVEATEKVKPRLLIEHVDPHRTVAALRDILAKTGELYDRGVPVRIAADQTQGGAVAQIMGPDALILMAHEVCRPYIFKKDNNGVLIEVDARLSRSYLVLYLTLLGKWRLPLLNGIASAPLQDNDGTIHCTEGYNQATGMWCEKVPDLTDLVPERPSRDDAKVALRLIRETFKTFCFSDAETIVDVLSGSVHVDINLPPGSDESGFLAALLTAVCRPSLRLAPAALFKAAPMSGAGTGKGLLARCISEIAFGRAPHAVTSGGKAEELEKRIASELIEGSPVLFLDNLNNIAFRSDLLASAITERPARVRVLGKSQMLPLNPSCFVILTGNGLTVSEDLARRFIETNLDAGVEDPESRIFENDILVEVKKRRAELLAALLTIWRWGRQSKDIKPGKSIGSFEQWGIWVRDPLLALGCMDPIDRISEAKSRDGRRQEIAELFTIWWVRHGDQPMTVNELDPAVKAIFDPQDRGRHFQSARLQKLDGTRMASFILTKQLAAGKWGPATYALEKTDGSEEHRGHRGHGGEELL